MRSAVSGRQALTWMNFWMASCWFTAADSVTKSILFWRMMMSLRRMISTAAKCSEVCGWGQDSLAAISSSAPSMTAAPLSMVAIRMSWPGQSTKETCRTCAHTGQSRLK